ncbi:MAG: holo-ACP synthase [Coprobacillaceae bacterium]
MIKGIGVDIVNLHRIRKNKNALAKKILTEKELHFFEGLTSEKRQIEFLGGRFAGKEAFFKAVSNKVPFKDIEILNDIDGKPYCNHNNIHISLAHEDDYAIAYVIFEK